MFPLIRTQIIQIFQSRCNNLILQFMTIYTTLEVFTNCMDVFTDYLGLFIFLTEKMLEWLLDDVPVTSFTRKFWTRWLFTAYVFSNVENISSEDRFVDLWSQLLLAVSSVIFNRNTQMTKSTLHRRPLPLKWWFSSSIYRSKV